MRNHVILPTALLAILFVGGGALSGQALGEARSGPAIPGFGPVYSVDDPTFTTDIDAQYRIVFEVAQGAGSPDQINARIETLARFLNMHAQVGVPRENMKLALVLHGTAGKDALGHDGYRRRYGIDNPNAALLEALGEFGVRIILCGQTQMHRGLERGELAPSIEVALSAMTAIASLTSGGYQLIAF